VNRIRRPVALLVGTAGALLVAVGVALVALPALSHPDDAVPPVPPITVGTPLARPSVEAPSAGPSPAVTSPDDGGLMIDSGAALRPAPAGTAAQEDAAEDASS
jgi:hypothetical protein